MQIMTESIFKKETELDKFQKIVSQSKRLNLVEASREDVLKVCVGIQKQKRRRSSVFPGEAVECR